MQHNDERNLGLECILFLKMDGYYISIIIEGYAIRIKLKFIYRENKYLIWRE